MKFLRLLAVLALLYGAVWALSTSFAKGETSVPAIGPLFNPFTGFWRNAEPLSGPVLPGEIKLPGLKGKVEVIYDDLFVPHVFAETREDAAMVQGYITAQNRLFQMDLTTRKVAGRLSEVIGPRTLETDRKSRRKGLLWAAERDFEIWKKSEEAMTLIRAYTEGVNAWITQMKPADYPVEFKILGYQPEPWTELKCVMVMEAMADMLARYDDDLEATNARQLLGEETYNALYPAWNPKQRPVIPEGFYPENPTALPQKTSPGAGNPIMSEAIGMKSVGELAEPLTDPVIQGSNNWAVAGSKTANGKPLLANDPHLGLTLPSIWFQVQLHTPEANVYGVSLAGLPGVVIGFNENIAWGITNVGLDVSDWYKVQFTDAARTTYLLDGTPVKAELKIEAIQVKGMKEPVIDTIRYTTWGPVVYNDPKEPLYNHAFRWVAHDAGPAIPLMNFANLDKAKNFNEYTAAMSGFDSPASNIVYADRHGDIAMRVQGQLPIRRGTEGRFIQDGAQSASAWRGYIPQDEIPKMHNPGRGFVTSANQNSTAPSYPYYFPYGEWEQYRGRRAVEMLEKMNGATIDSMKAMQNNTYSLRAQDAKNLMLSLLDRSTLNPAQQALVADIEQWNCHYDKNLTAPSLFDMWFDSTYVQTFDEVFAFRDQKINIQLPPAWRCIELLEKDTDNVIFDLKNTPEKESARQIVSLAFQKMAGQAAKEALTNNLVWGNFHSLTINHLARIAPFSRINIPTSGHRSALNAILRDHGPSWRMIVELGDEVKGVGVYPGGQSGNPGSRFYDNMLDYWMNGQYYDLLFWKKPEDATAEKTYTKQVFSH